MNAGGNHLVEMLQRKSIFDSAEREIYSWVSFIQSQSESLPPSSLIAIALEYVRDETKVTKKGLHGAILDLGMLLSTNKSAEAERIKVILRARQPKKDNFITIDDEYAEADKIRSELREVQIQGEFKSAILPLILYFMLKYECIRCGSLDVKRCLEIANQWVDKGFLYEIRDALWLVGVRAHASNFAEEYRSWWLNERKDRSSLVLHVPQEGAHTTAINTSNDNTCSNESLNETKPTKSKSKSGKKRGANKKSEKCPITTPKQEELAIK
jgi:hypothetical protein